MSALSLHSTAKQLHALIYGDGLLGRSRNANMRKLVQVLSAVKPAAAINQALAHLSDADLLELARNVNSQGKDYGLLGNPRGLELEEKCALFDLLAKNLQGRQLERLAHAFNSREDLRELTEAIAVYSTVQARVDFIACLVALKKSKTHSRLRRDKKALAIGIVLGSLAGTPHGFNQAVKVMGPDHLDDVVKSAVKEGFGEDSLWDTLYMVTSAAVDNQDPLVASMVLRSARQVGYQAPKRRRSVPVHPSMAMHSRF